MKAIFTFAFAILGCISLASNVSTETARKAAENKLSIFPEGFQIQAEQIFSAGAVEFYVYTLSPSGFIIVTGNTQLAPVYAYSSKGTFDAGSPLFSFVSNDIQTRFQALNVMPLRLLQERENAWSQLLSGPAQAKEFQQWPEAGTTPTEGWLWDNWTQNYPYNMMCPMDPVTSVRSIAGCPSVAMAMILNFHQTVNGVVFSDNDDYYHNYAGRQYYIDDDYVAQDFPSFNQLNTLLGILSDHYATCTGVDDIDRGALTFACGVACTQVYTSSGSGTFGVSQALAAYQKFNFTESQLLFESTPDLYTIIAQNIIDTLPVHLAVVDQGETMGHNVVVDGYNTDGYYHLNFGWGGTYNGWYSLPDEIPYGLTVIEGAVVNIIPDNSVDAKITENPANTIYPNPASDFIYFDNSENKITSATLYSLTGKIVRNTPITGEMNSISVKGIKAGIYMIRLNSISGVENYKVVVK
ncbi:MAG: hypothetical protein CVU05_14985 [Bacteroidetes bacterium HGW-Bacteroidetes-21]|jgi:hypothetical protein|nr:MAG: hypothetical protein CVU05_14985 [Bacteroidetes bacterium HGW-Bacteroidetes-21]